MGGSLRQSLYRLPFWWAVQSCTRSGSEGPLGIESTSMTARIASRSSLTRRPRSGFLTRSGRRWHRNRPWFDCWNPLVGDNPFSCSGSSTPACALRPARPRRWRSRRPLSSRLHRRPSSLTATMAPVSTSTACSALWARCVRPVLHLVTLASGSCGFLHSLFDVFILPPSCRGARPSQQRRQPFSHRDLS